MSNDDEATSTSTETNNESAEFLTLEFKPFEPVYRWKCMPECDEFVGPRRSKHTVVAFRDAIYVFGGDSGKVMLNDLLRFDVKEKSWGRAFTNGFPPPPRYHHSAVVHDSSMFVFGGFTGDIQGNSNLRNQNDLFEYRFLTCQWIEWKFTGRAPVPRSAHGAAVYDDKLWIFAGYDGNSRLNDMWTINLKGDNHLWEEIDQIGDCPPTCCNFPVAVARDSMYVFSGQSGAKITNSLFYFKFKEKCWTRISTDHILRGAPPPPTRSFDLDSETWSIIPPASGSEIPSGRLFHASAVVGDAMYVFGGTVYNNMRSGDMYRFQIASYPKCTLADDFGRLLKNELFVDVEFIVGLEEIKIRAHRVIVAARSPYLRNRILENITEYSSQLEVELSVVRLKKKGHILQIRQRDAVPEAFKMALSYIYTDKVDPSCFIDEADANKIVLVMLDVYRLAVQYAMPRLEYLCVQYLESAICLQNVLIVLHNASNLGLVFIKDFCLRFIVRECNYNRVVMSKEFENIDKSLMVEMIRRKQVPPTRTTQLEPEIESLGIKHVLFKGITLQQDMERFLKVEGKPFSDITILLDKEEIKAHKAVLAARCSYFEAMFRSFMPKDNQVQITIGDIIPSRQSVDSLLRYIYYGEVEMPPEDSLYLFSAPHFFGFTNNRLQAFCKQNLEMNVKIENVIQILEAADRIQAIDMKKYALSLIVRDFPKVAQMPQMKQLSRNLLLDILEALANNMADRRLFCDMSSLNINFS
ncbi:Leucine-zipper-like transcriptional regulator 1 [Armadillidium nasatum]|uniref:Leucine-zipper-like transcriptional regulator 1 n=1 Tax=Armadillidium nasatum TaxID=96803 RepID=A0A5N5T3R6_9CRUS|nr:Leucine-zipper-like transcriptional regulator 1 [Armadillidium nasatum]